MKAPGFSKLVQCFAGVAVLAALNSFAAVTTLTHNNSSVDIDPASSAGMFNWRVDGVDYLAQQWFWFRAGSMTSESPINSISAASISNPNARTLTTSYANASYGIDITYILTGQSAGSGLSGVQESIRITNFTASPIDFHFFQYSDFDLGGNDNVTLGKNNFGLFNEALQTSGSFKFSESVVTPGANHGQASLFPVILNSLNDGSATTLSDATSAGPGDVTWGLEWDFTLAGNGSFGISKLKDLQIPEPTTAALVGIGLLGLIWRKRSQLGK